MRAPASASAPARSGTALLAAAAELGERSLAERRHAALLRHASDIVLVVSRSGKVLDVTPAIHTVLGWEPEAVLLGSLFDIVDGTDRDRVAQELSAVAEQPGPTGTSEFRARHRDGSLRWLEVTGNNLLDDPAVAALVVTARDVTERHEANALLAAENEILQQIASDAPLDKTLGAICLLVEARVNAAASAVWLADGDGLVLAAASSLDRAGSRGAKGWRLDQSVIDLANEPPTDVSVRTTASPHWNGWHDVSSDIGVVCSWGRVIIDPSGNVLGRVNAYLAQERTPTTAESQVMELASHLAGMAHAGDRVRKELAHAATHDALTGLPNRTMFLDRLGLVHGAAAVLFVDLDDFKKVNDTSGHAVGDELLREAASRLAAVVRPIDLIARLGGDEFAVLCEGLTVEGATDVAGRVLEALEEPFLLDGRSFHVSASAGIAVGGPDTSPDLVLRDADTAMYEAKRDGRGRHAVFTPAVREANVRRLALEQDLRRAIDAEELTVHYQPVVSLTSGALIGMEALARWSSPIFGVVPPPEFIDVAEQAGVIAPLGESILRQAVTQASAWRASGLIADRTTIAVNVSARQLGDPGFVGMVMTTLDEAHLPPTSLCIELTESAVMADIEGAQATLGLLRGFGVTVAIDDFGTGHSSLARLRALEATVLKLDRMFILDLDVDPGSVELVGSVIQLAHAVGKSLIVEGVERPSQLNVLKTLGADAAQGFLLARPQPAAAMEGFLRMIPSW